MKRKLGPSESILYKINRLSSTNVAIIVKLGGDLDQSKIKAALQALIIKYPILRARIKENDSIPCFYDTSIKDFSLQLFHYSLYEEKDHISFVEEALNRRFNVSEEPLWNVHYLTSNSKNILVFTFHHAIMAARTAFVVIDDFLKFYGQESPDIQPYPAGTQIETAVPLSNIKPLLTSLRILSNAVFRKVTIAPPDKTIAYNERIGKLISWEIEEKVSRRVVEQCKMTGVTVTAYISTLMLVYAYKRLNTAKPKFLSLMVAVDMVEFLRRLNPDLKQQISGTFVSHIYLNLKMTGKERISNLLKKIDRRIKSSVKRGEPIDYINLKRMTYKNSQTPIQLLEQVDKFSPSSAILTNIGKLPITDKCGDVDVENASFCYSLSASGGTAIALCVTNYKDRLTLNFLYNEGLTLKQDAEVFVDNFKKEFSSL